MKKNILTALIIMLMSTVTFGFNQITNIDVSSDDQLEIVLDQDVTLTSDECDTTKKEKPTVTITWVKITA